MAKVVCLLLLLMCAAAVCISPNAPDDSDPTTTRFKSTFSALHEMHAAVNIAAQNLTRRIQHLEDDVAELITDIDNIWKSDGPIVVRTLLVWADIVHRVHRRTQQAVEMLSHLKERRPTFNKMEDASQLLTYYLAYRLTRSWEIQRLFYSMPNATLMLNTAFPLRLRGGDSDNMGGVEIQLAGVWGSFCRDHMTSIEGKVICRTLGKPTGSTQILVSSAATQFYRGAILLRATECEGREPHVLLCRSSPLAPHNTTQCPTNDDAVVRCSEGSRAPVF